MADSRVDRALLSALEELAGAETPGLIAEARAEARSQVKARLVELMSEAMLARARKELRPEKTDRPGSPAKPEPRPAVEDPPAPAAQATALYVYCVVPADTTLPESLSAVDPDHPPTLISHEQLAAVVSRVPLADFQEERLRERLADLAWLERTARAHEAVLEAIAEDSTLVPMRLCSVYRSESGVVEMLFREAEGLEAALAHLANRSEWAVKVFAVAPKSETSDAGEPASGTDYMRQRQSQRDRQRAGEEERHEACQVIHDRLGAIAAEARTIPPQRAEVSGYAGEMVLNGVYLVGDETLARFLDEVDALQGEFGPSGLDLEPTGPWPAYNFVPGAIGAAW